MRKFEPTKKGIIEFQGVEYKLKLDSITMTLIMVDSVQKLETERKKANDLQQSFERGDIELNDFIERVEVSLDAINRHSERFCRRVLGSKVFDVIETASGGLTFDDYNNLTTIIMQELAEIKNDTNNSLTKGVDRFE